MIVLHFGQRQAWPIMRSVMANFAWHFGQVTVDGMANSARVRARFRLL
jgi:hypothetical protein